MSSLPCTSFSLLQQRRKAGRLTFLPLNRLSTTPISYPDTTGRLLRTKISLSLLSLRRSPFVALPSIPSFLSTALPFFLLPPFITPKLYFPSNPDVRSLMEVALKFDPIITPAVSQVFGKKLLARDLDIAARYSRECQLDAITKEGDVVSRKGGFEGGYHDERSSKILSVLKIKESRTRLEALTQQSQILKHQCDQAEAEVNNSLRELQVVEEEREHVKNLSSRLIAELSSRRRSLGIAKDNLEKRRTGGLASIGNPL